MTDTSPIATAIGSDGFLHINGARLTATQTDSLIERLADLRAQMDPPVSMTPIVETTVGVTTDPTYALQEDLADQTLMMFVRHVGRGWCAFEFTRPAAAELRDELAHFTGNQAPAPSARGAGGTAH